MGCYLSLASVPVTDKYSSDESNDKLNCGTSCMQGWRDSQEDAHNCIIEYDTNTSYFAVYDGHGGPEVALYCSQNLPDFLKELDDYKKGSIEKALEDGFLKFDATITTKKVVSRLIELKEEAREKQGDKDSEEEEENVNNLYEEAAMPIEQVIEKYKARKIFNDPSISIKNDASPNNSTANSTHIAETSGEVVSSSSCVSSMTCDITKKKSSEENPVTTCSTAKESNEVHNNEVKVETKVDSPDSSADRQEVCTASDDATEKKVSNQNGEVESTQNCESSKSDVTSSSTTIPQENGEVVRKGKGKALTKTKGVLPKTPITERPKRTAKQYYNSILSLEECSEEESEDEKDETFEGPNDDSSDDDDEIDELAGVEDNSEESSIDEEEEEEDEDDDDEDIGFNEGEFLRNMEEGPGLDSGCTAVVALLKGNDLYVANAGDSRCVVCRNGQAIEMSIDHKPEDEPEHSRIIKAGGFICDDGRVNGGLNLSRAIGDHAYKQNKDLSDREQMITAQPDIKTLTIEPGKDEFMILACDGIWNCMSSQEVVDFVRSRMQEGRDKLSQICEELFDHCLAPKIEDGTGCDNMTAVIVEFKSNSLKRPLPEPDELERCKRIRIEEAEVSA